MNLLSRNPLKCHIPGTVPSFQAVFVFQTFSDVGLLIMSSSILYVLDMTVINGLRPMYTMLGIYHSISDNRYWRKQMTRCCLCQVCPWCLIHIMSPTVGVLDSARSAQKHPETSHRKECGDLRKSWPPCLPHSQGRMGAGLARRPPSHSVTF